MAAGADPVTVVDRLIDLFNRRSLDVPDGVFTRQTQLLLNDVPFEERLGRAPTDPLVLMLARGPAGYRFAAKAVQHAVPDARLQRGELARHAEGEAETLAGQCWLSGHFRGTGEPAEILIEIVLRFQGPSLIQMAAAVDERVLDQLRDARQRP